MANTCVMRLTITGASRESVKELFDNSAVATECGFVWNIPGYGEIMACDGKHGDGITVNGEAIIIQGECKWSPPLAWVEEISRQYPDLEVEVHGKDVGSLYLQRWVFRAGDGILLDCVQGAYEGEGEAIIYMRDGIQFKKLPMWVAADDQPEWADDQQDRKGVTGMILNAPLKWHGGKSYLADWIISVMPPHHHYVEPFAGGLAVMLRKSPEGISEVVNDLDGELSNLWQVLKDESRFQEFTRRVEATPFSQVEFENANNSNGDLVDRAVRFFIRCRQSRQGLRKDFATLSKNRTRRGMNEQVSSWLTAVDGLPDVHARLKRVVILNDDAVTVIRKEDSPNTLFYLDPPYLHETRVTTTDYAVEMTANDHIRLLSALGEIEGKFMLSGYPNAMYDDAAAANGWYRVEREIDCKASSSKEKPKRTEVLWMNYQPH